MEARRCKHEDHASLTVNDLDGFTIGRESLSHKPIQNFLKSRNIENHSLLEKPKEEKVQAQENLLNGHRVLEVLKRAQRFLHCSS